MITKKITLLIGTCIILTIICRIYMYFTFIAHSWANHSIRTCKNESIDFVLEDMIFWATKNNYCYVRGFTLQTRVTRGQIWVKQTELYDGTVL